MQPVRAPFVLASELSGLSGLLDFAKDPLGCLERAKIRHGALIRFQSIAGQSLLISEPAVVEEMLLSRHADCIKEIFNRQLGIVLGNGLTVSEGELWKRQRRLAAPSFARSEINNYADAMARRASHYAAKVEVGDRRNVHKDMQELTLNIVVDAFLGASAPPAHEVGDVLEEVMIHFQKLSLTWRGMFPTWVPFRSRRMLRKQRRRLEVLISRMIDEKRCHKREQGDLLSRFIAATDEAGERMSDRQLLDETITVFVAGHETVALALTYCLDLLARHPEEQGKLRSELEEVLGGNRPTANSYEALRYTRAVVNETLRLYAPFWAFGRETIRPTTLAGASVPRHVRLVVCPWLLHRDARWFAEPLRFRPERWLDGSMDRIPRFSYLPFGAGPRTCIGSHFALMEAVMVLASLLGKHGVRGAGPDLPALSPSVTLRPKGPVCVTFGTAGQERSGAP